jgi:hypothetical protein
MMIRQEKEKRMEIRGFAADEQDPSSLMALVMEDYQNQEWISLYQAAVIELDHAKMAVRVKAAQTAIVTRMGKLSTVPEQHARERQAIADALYGLRTLERELHPKSGTHET